MKEDAGLGWKRTLENIAFMLHYAVKYTPGYLFSVCLFELFASVEVFLEFTYSTKYLLEVLETGKTWRDAISYMIFITFLVVLKIVLAGILEQRLVPFYTEKLRKKLRMELYEKAADLDLERYDNPEYYNTFVWSIHEADGRMDKNMFLFLMETLTDRKATPSTISIWKSEKEKRLPLWDTTAPVRPH